MLLYHKLAQTHCEIAITSIKTKSSVSIGNLTGEFRSCGVASELVLVSGGHRELTQIL